MSGEVITFPRRKKYDRAAAEFLSYLTDAEVSQIKQRLENWLSASKPDREAKR